MQPHQTCEEKVEFLTTLEYEFYEQRYSYACHKQKLVEHLVNWSALRKSSTKKSILEC